MMLKFVNGKYDGFKLWHLNGFDFTPLLTVNMLSGSSSHVNAEIYLL